MKDRATYEQLLAIGQDLKAKGTSDTEILSFLFDMYMDGKIKSRKELSKLVKELGYTLYEELLNDKTHNHVEF